ncbi:hypothetical protein SK128_021197 [Halocaridina rubra]|uniref:Uncharacterized protein n=1 Tax=Halocaridina rubra TaxID=373956 RepID=A0AAN8XGF9_HALRR
MAQFAKEIETALGRKRYERFRFRQCTHNASESVDTFVTKLKELASTCEFHNMKDVIIHQVIANYNSHEFRTKTAPGENPNIR